jgi:geranylgeranyl diphosphate synthase, type II
LALENVTWNTGLWGVTGGQYLDLYPPNLTAETVREAILKKTGTLFEISFVLG